MSQYYTETYKKYYDKLTSSPVSSSSLKDHATELDENTKKLVSFVESTTWKELGKTEVVNSIIPSLKNRINIYMDNINNCLVPAADKTSNELYPLLEQLNTKEAELVSLEQELEYDAANNIDNSNILPVYNKKVEEMKELSSKVKTVLDEINSLNSLKNLDGSNITGAISNNEVVKEESKTNQSNNSFVDTISNSATNYVDVPYVAINTNLPSSVAAAKKKIKARRRNIFGKDIIEDFLKIKRRLANKKTTNKKLPAVPINNSSTVDYSSNNKVTKWNTLGNNWVVTNTKFSVSDYANYAYSKGIRQDSNSSRYGDLCLAFSYVHASNMRSGSTGDNAESAVNWAHAGEFYDYFSDNKQTTLKTVYNEIVKGNPVIMQVNGNSEGTHRHFVTVLGFKDSVTSGDTIKESDLLILDSWDGKIETMDTNYSRFMTTGAQTGKTYSGYYLRLFR